MGCECIEHCGIHVFEDICIVEVVDKLNRPVPPGSLGHKCLLTNLYNKTQPLIRYEISDMLTKSTEPCSCGRPFPLIKQIAGRSEDILILKDGQGRDIAIPPVVLGARIESLLEVAEYEIRHNPEHIRLKVVPSSGADIAKLQTMLLKEVKSTVTALGAVPPPVEVMFASQLERQRDHMGKIKLVGGLPAGSTDAPSSGENI